MTKRAVNNDCPSFHSSMSFSGSGRFRFPGTADKRFNHTPLVVLFHISEMDHVLPLQTGGNHQERGVICGTIGAAMNVDIRLVGGAMLSGVYFGDRCSPVSTSALLVADIICFILFVSLWASNAPRLCRSLNVGRHMSAQASLAITFRLYRTKKASTLCHGGSE